jgi:glycosyltransferase involved in cell wall biosynthesis
MIKILYIVSTLKRAGPAKQLLNLINNLDRTAFEPYVITLSSEPEHSFYPLFQACNVTLQSLNLSRLSGLFLARRQLESVIKVIQPDILHSQGIRPDVLLANFRHYRNRVCTIHNFAPEDYPSKYPRPLAYLMTRRHFDAMRKFDNIIACSETVQRKLASRGVRSKAIQNGVESSSGQAQNVPSLQSLPRPLFVSVGGLVPLKHMGLVVDAYSRLRGDQRGSLVILGDGPLRERLSGQASGNVKMPGSVSNVGDYLAAADYFVSASGSEGLPYAVLEALMAGLPVILSDIESHKEIATSVQSGCKLFSLDGGAADLAEAMQSVKAVFGSTTPEMIQSDARVFSAEVMTQKYQDFYTNMMDKNGRI